MMIRTKTFSAAFKALETQGGKPGEFEALVSVFDVVDRAGDRVKSTAFDKTIKAWRDSGDPIPVILSHKWDDPMAIIGHADPNNVKAVPGQGLYVKGQLHVGRGNETADQVHYLMQQRLLKEWSFGYTVPQGGEKRASDGAYDITELSLIEVGPCLKGVNPETELLVVKSTKPATARTKAYVDLQLEGSYEEAQDELSEALAAAYPSDPANGVYTYAEIIATYRDRVVYGVTTVTENGQREDEYYSRSYTVDGDEYTLGGDETEMDIQAVPAPNEPNEEPEPGEKSIPTARTKAWDGAASNYTDAEYANACIVDRGASYSDSAKQRYSVPIAAPGKSYTDSDPDALAPAAAALAGGRAPLADVTDAQLKAAYRKLKDAYAHHDLTPPDSVTQGAKSESPPPDPEIQIAELEIEAAQSRMGYSLNPEALETARLDDELAAKLGL